ncbi:MAG: ceramidase domain-containing protein [Gammaproteobacteria bacterium]|nr:ceramidase domain-containing protein [Gammaproteobacteria bacterium]
MIDIYCERLGPGLWAEPVNALTNLAFFISAFMVWVLAKQRELLSTSSWLLIILIVGIGLGSGLFHSFATGWARLLDELSILMFQIVFLWLYCQYVISLRVLLTGCAVLAFVLISLIMPQFSHLLNGSLAYAPALAVLLVLAIYHYRHAGTERRILLWAVLVLALSLSLRTIDIALCESFALGTHFLWHVLNGLVLYLVTRGLLLQQAHR